METFIDKNTTKTFDNSDNYLLKIEINGRCASNQLFNVLLKCVG